MYNPYNKCPNYNDSPWYNSNSMYGRRMYPLPYFYPMYSPEYMNRYPMQFPYDVTEYDSAHENWPYQSNDAVMNIMDYGPNPVAVDIKEATLENESFRTALWTGDHLQITLMNLLPGEEIGLEMHPNVDQFVRIEEGDGVVRMGDGEDLEDFEANVYDDFIFVIPAGKWHNLYNVGNIPLKLYSIYAPPQHPHGTVHKTKEDAEAMH